MLIGLVLIAPVILPISETAKLVLWGCFHPPVLF